MKRVQFYLCPSCGNLLCSTGTAEISCCGRKLEPLQAKPADEIHRLTVEEVEDEFFVTSSHPMEKAHYLSFIALVTCDRAVLVRLYPEQSVQVRLPRMRRGKLYACCSEGGLCKVICSGSFGIFYEVKRGCCVKWSADAGLLQRFHCFLKPIFLIFRSGFLAVLFATSLPYSLF